MCHLYNFQVLFVCSFLFVVLFRADGRRIIFLNSKLDLPIGGDDDNRQETDLFPSVTRDSPIRKKRQHHYVEHYDPYDHHYVEHYDPYDHHYVEHYDPYDHHYGEHYAPHEKVIHHYEKPKVEHYDVIEDVDHYHHPHHF